MAGITYLRDHDGSLLRSAGWATDIWAPGAQAWRAWPTDWPSAHVSEVSREHAAAIAGSDANLDQPAVA